MKKSFLAGILAVSLLFTGCSKDDDSNAESKLKTLNFQVNDTSGFQKQAVNCEGESIEVESKSVVNKSAMNKIDWSSAPRFNNQSDFMQYLNECRIDLQETLPVVFTNGFKPDINEAIKVVPTWYMEWTYRQLDPKTTAYLFEISEYPGERVAYAYLNNDTSFLDEEEMQLYDFAVKFVNELKNVTDNLLWQELFIHTLIAENTTYYNEKPQPARSRFQTALGALIDGKANCQGYTDAFYMLGNICGINVGRVNGYANNELHTWNTVNFNDDRTYFTDVTWDDAAFKFDEVEYPTFAYFNASTDIVGTTHQWFTDYAPKNLQPTPDGRDFYFTQEYFNSNEQYFGYHFDSAQAALDYIAKRVANGWKISWMCAPYDAYYADYKNSLNYLLQVLPNQYGWNGNITINIVNRGNKYLFIMVDAKPH